jgi:hypothetical protein
VTVGAAQSRSPLPPLQPRSAADTREARSATSVPRPLCGIVADVADGRITRWDRAWVLVVTATACASPPADEPIQADTGAESTSTGSETTGEPLPAACNCVPNEAIARVPSCLPLLCDVSATCPDSGCSQSSGEIVVDELALTCALEALRDGTPGVIVMSQDYGGVNAGRAGYIIIGEDGWSITRRRMSMDLAYQVCDAVLGALPPSDEFSLCLGYESTRNRFECLWFRPDGPLVTCDSDEDWGGC